ncbi:hypothetical protein SLEP1_g2175 [Rubroshorea leprosula]|uniref:TF-B3 domain-containing protein n=1 Tax=Rubroshorea leprosula TaxID=152421 RepID=A0AAV5HNH8_9ROSI|nr:hypothetical protein SLEP1_g2175 [Rubroshorea leprosula]
MNFGQGEKGYCNNEEEDDERVIGESTATDFPFSSSSSPKYKGVVNPDHHHHQQQQQQQKQHQNLWLLDSLDNSQEDQYKVQKSDINFDKKLELMDLSLGSNEESNGSGGGGSVYGGGGGGGDSSNTVEKEHMFDKVVTPSDVGKLNRLVIPKQHAERYFPLDSSSSEKGLLLNFEDRNGKSWRFRYSYWNSSQSYVMTKGWSRFVKEKKLDPGDIVSFQRGVGESGRDRLYIDWRRRPDAPDPSTLAHIQFPNRLNFPQQVRWGNRLYSLPQSVSMPQPNYEPLHRLNYSIYPYNHHHHPHLHQQQGITYANVGQFYLGSSGSSHHHQYQIGSVPVGSGGVPMLINSSAPVAEVKTEAKRLRLFGVNMDCPVQDESSTSIPHGKAVAPFPSLQSRSQIQQSEYSKKGKSSLSIDLDL